MKKFFKKFWNKFDSRTPKSWVRVGHALIAATTFGTASEIIRDHHSLAIIILICGMVGYFLINLFEDKINGTSTKS